MDALFPVLEKAPLKERRALAKLLKANSARNSDILAAFRWYSQSFVGKIFDTERSYLEIVRQVAEKLKIRGAKQKSAKDLEVQIAKKILKRMWSKMTPEQRKQMEDKLREEAMKYGKKGRAMLTGSIFAALTAAQLSGFAVFMLASTTLGAVATGLGVVLPFAAFQAMAGAIAVIIGPVGWLGGALLAAWALGGPNYQRLVSGVVYVCALRAIQRARPRVQIGGR